MPEIIITVATVGASPRHINPQSLKYLPYAFVQAMPCLNTALKTSQDWVETRNGSFVISESTKISLSSEFIQNIGAPCTTEGNRHLVQENGLIENAGDIYYHHHDKPPGRLLSRELLARITSKKLINKLVLHLTSQGWAGDSCGNLVWEHEGPMETYIPPQLIGLLKSADERVVEGFLASGWRIAGPGYVLSTSGASPWLPITPKTIVEESAAAVSEGATIIHLHTRKILHESSWELPWSTLPLVLGTQANQIVPTDYDVIVPELRAIEPLAIINLSTSARGDNDSESSIRRAHLKEYGPDGAPEICSMCPGEVLFTTGTGYQNSPKFLQQQLAHCQRYNIRPEIEVFNRTILRETLSSFKPRLAKCGMPCIVMLVAGVDQQRRAEKDELEDDSLIPISRRKDIFSLLYTGTNAGRNQALEMTVADLAPIVKGIRRNLPHAKISTLLAGPMQQLLAPVAFRLGLDGVRVGLEDGLSVFNPVIPGGVGKGSSAEQVRHLREELQALGYHVLSLKDTRRVLCMPTSAESLFLAAMDVTSHLTTSNAVSGDITAAMSDALRPLHPAFESREKWLLEQMASQSWDDNTKITLKVREIIKNAGLYVRYFFEERDRYPPEGASKFGNIHDIYDIQSLNYVYELLQKAGQDAKIIQQGLQDIATSCGISRHSLLTHAHQRKSFNLRFLEYLVSLSCSFSPDYTEVSNTSMRERVGYNSFLAGIFKAIDYEYKSLRSVSEAEAKSNQLLAFHVCQSEGYITLKDLRSQISLNDWIMLPNSGMTNYPEGKRLSQRLGAIYLSHLKRMIPYYADSLRLLGLIHPGLDEDGDPIIESSLLYNRFLLGTSRHTSIVGYPSRLLYEAILLPQLVKQPDRLLYDAEGLIVRKDGLPLYDDRTIARRIDACAIEGLPPLRFLAYSSGIATVQQMDNAMRDDMEALGYSHAEQSQLFNRNVVVSFGSAADINLDLAGTPTVDITAYNDIRCMAGTTTPDYLMHDTRRHRQAGTTRAGDIRYSDSRWKLICGPAGKTVLRRTGVYLRGEPFRHHDGHLIRRYLEGAPEPVAVLVEKLHCTTVAPRFDFTLRELATA
ncbi:hypothetical protein LAWI1_G006440 [Lachnellula willkommii]|uniref:Uncharacterized protein n=1 Tax=Lachnellula willkommii TaxID=215461 RepID=A0A559M832_9HELO|nr:hypothetical protein LAWI1_G006440 [Lachnellula willkommii]